MNIRDYYFGQPVTLRTRLPAEQVIQRINEAARVAWWKLPLHIGPVGGFRFGRLRLRYVSSLFEYNAKPVLVGDVDSAPDGTVLRLVYRGRTWFRIFYAFWYAFLFVCFAVFLTVGTDPPLQGAERLFPFAILAGLAIFPVVLHAIGTRNSDRELRELVSFLEEVAEAREE